MHTQSEYLNTIDAAAYLRISRKSLEMARCRGDGPPFIKVGRTVRYERNALDGFMRAHLRTKTVRTCPAKKSLPDQASGSRVKQSARASLRARDR